MKHFSILLFACCNPSVDVASSSSQKAADAPLAISATIDVPAGRAFFLAAKADKGAINAWLAGNGYRFVAGYPEDFPDGYWGLNVATDAYLFLMSETYADSTWTLGAQTRTGAFKRWSVEVWGFQTDENGAPMGDWVALQVMTALDGESLSDMINFYQIVFGETVGAGAPFTLSYGDNGNACSHETQAWETCVYWNDQAYGGAEHRVFKNAGLTEWQFAHFDMNWVKFDPKTDAFSSPLPVALQPMFWVRGNDYKLSLQ